MTMKPVEPADFDRSRAANLHQTATTQAGAIIFEREDRYIVIKISKLTAEQLQGVKHHIAIADIPTTECVVVEHDWPEYETVWGMLEDRFVSERTIDVPDLHQAETPQALPMTATPAPPHVQRVHTERRELLDKIEKLNDFTYTPTFEALAAADRDLLDTQLRVMRKYDEILVARLKRFGCI